MKKAVMTFSILILSIVIVLLINGSKSDIDVTYQIVNDINYTESLKELNNPERGFYEPIGINMQENNNKVLNPKNNLVHLRVGIGAFSGKVNGKSDIKFTDDMLSALDQTLKNIKANGGSVIIRFAYDNFNGTKDLEPSLDILLTHIKQLKTLFNNNKDVIAYVELGFFGPWGEMHSSQICNKENVSKAITTMLDSVPKNIKIGVRTPAYYASWANVSLDKLNEDIPKSNSDAYRVGLYNDGYLGSESDLGTFKNREVEIGWLNNQATHTLYGGEVVANYASGTPLNTIDYISKEGFITHTTYLNLRWNNNVIDSWKNTNYNGEDSLYKGQTAFLYINNHLGYRFVLKSSKITKQISIGEHLKGIFDIENVGFGNLVNEKKTTIILASKDKTYEISTNIDPRLWNSKEITQIPYDISLPENIAKGEYKVYLRISQSGNYLNDNNYNCIEFANANIWDEKLGANYIGSINIEEKSSITLNKITTSSTKKTTKSTLTTKVINLKPATTSTTKKTTTSTTKKTTSSATTTTNKIITTKPSTTITTTTTTKPIISDDILYETPSDEYSETTTTITTTTKPATTTRTITYTTSKPKTTTIKITNETTTKKKVSTTTSKKQTTTTSTTSKINEEIQDEEAIIQENSTSSNIKAIVVLLLVAILLILIFLNHKNI